MIAARRGKTKAVVEVAKAGADLNLQNSVRHISMCCYTNDIHVGVVTVTFSMWYKVYYVITI